MYLPFTRSDFNHLPATILIALTIFIALFHFPLVYIQDNSIGFFDVWVIFLFFCIIIRSIFKHRFTLTNWIPLLAVVFADICYYFLRVNYYLITDKQILLIVKYLEHFFLIFILIYFLENEKINYPMLIKLLKIILLGLVLFQIQDLMGGGPERNRLSLPFTLTKSPNPAAFVLGAAVIFYIEYILKHKQRLLVKLIDIGIFTLIIIALLLTLSRTNFLALILSFGVVYFIKGFKYPKRLLITVVIIAAIIIVFYGALLIIISNIQAKVVQRYAYILTDPTTVFNDPSFYIRFAKSWPAALDNWQSNIFTVFFGKGLAYVTVVDGSYHRLLSNQGLVGLLFFIYIWMVFFLKRFRFSAMWVLIVFIAVNAITADTLVVSYRSIQGFMVFLMMIIYFHRYYQKAEQPEEKKELTAET